MSLLGCRQLFAAAAVEPESAEEFVNSFDYSIRFSTASIVLLVIGLVLAVAVTAVLFVYVKRRYRFIGLALIYAMLAYMVGGYLLPSLVSMGFNAIGANAASNAALGAVMNVTLVILIVVFEVLAIYVCMKVVKKRENDFAVALYFPILYTATMLLMTSMSSVVNMAQYMMLINGGGLESAVQEAVTAGLADTETASTIYQNMQQVLAYCQQLVGIDLGYYLGIGMDVLLPLFIHIGVCVILGTILFRQAPAKKWIFLVIPEAIYAVFYALSVTVVSNSWVRIAGYLLAAVVSCVLAYRFLAEYAPEDLKKLQDKAPEKPSSGGGVFGKNVGPERPGHPTGKKMPKIVMPKDK